jgi:hypothetical protein
VAGLELLRRTAANSGGVRVILQGLVRYLLAVFVEGLLLSKAQGLRVGWEVVTKGIDVGSSRRVQLSARVWPKAPPSGA